MSSTAEGPVARRSVLRTDPRVERTQEVLRDALMALIEEKGFDRVSVQDITERARVNRATFYLHYRDKQDLLIKTSERVFDRLVVEAGPVDPENLDLHEPARQLIVLFEHVAAHGSTYRVLLGPSGVPAVGARIRHYLATFTQQRMSTIRAHYPEAVPILDDDFISQYVAGALLGIIIWWLDEGMPHTAEYMADRVGRLTVASAYPMMGIETPSITKGLE